MGKTLLHTLTSPLTILPVIFALFNISIGNNTPESDKDSYPPLACEENYQIRTVVIDPGHGGKDGGCTGATHSIEKHLALDMALKLGEKIKAHFPDVRVIYTRDRDVFIPLHRRAEIANENQADLFISIHCNNILNAAHVHGSETYVLGLHRAEDNLKVAKRENQAILMEDNYQKNYGGYDPNSAEGHIILSYVQNAYLEQSILFAEQVETHLLHKTGRKSRGVKQAGFLVLRNTTMPSVLIETGYLSNTGDEAYLMTEHGQNKVAEAILHAFMDYKYQMESGPAVAQLAHQPATRSFTKKSIPQQSLSKAALPPASRPAPIQPRQPTSKSPGPPTTERKTAPVTRPSLIIPMTPTTTSRPASAKRATISSGPVDSKPVFMVQLASANRLLNTNSGKWMQVPHSINVKKEKGLYKYLAIGFSDFNSAVNGQRQLRNLGFADAFVVAYHGKQRISLSDAKAMAK